MTSHTLQGKTALITGASSGLGVDFARQLSDLGCHLILVARREDRLQAVQNELRARHPLRVEIISLDLTTTDAAELLYAQVKTLDMHVDILINNAGFGLHGSFSAMEWARLEQLIDLDIKALVHLTHVFLPDMLARRNGYILQVASIAACQPSPGYAAYAAAKAFVWNFSEALDYELKGSGVSCTALLPGLTATEFMDVAGQGPTLYQQVHMMRSDDVVRIAIDALRKRRRYVITGWLNRLMAWFSPIMPRRFSTTTAHWLMREG